VLGAFVDTLISDITIQISADGIRKNRLSAVVINSETIAASTRRSPPRNLWKEARSGVHEVVFIGPEMLRSPEFSEFLLEEAVRCRLGQLTVDEVHLLDEWGADFRVAHQEISTLQARLPDHTAIVALSAAIEPGRQYEACIRALGLKFKNFHLEKRDCERRNVDLIIRPILFTLNQRVSRFGLAYPDINFEGI